MTHDLDLWPYDPKINGFPGLILKHFCVKFGDPSCINVLRYRAEKQTDTQTNGGKNQRLPSAWVIQDYRYNRLPSIRPYVCLLCPQTGSTVTFQVNTRQLVALGYWSVIVAKFFECPYSPDASFSSAIIAINIIYRLVVRISHWIFSSSTDWLYTSFIWTNLTRQYLLMPRAVK